MAEKNLELTGLSDDEAKAVHSLFMQGFAIFTAVAIVAHILVWMWRPWIPGPNGYSSVMEHTNNAVAAFQSIVPVLA